MAFSPKTKTLLKYIYRFGLSRGWSLHRKVYNSSPGSVTIKLPGLSSPFYLRKGTSDVEAFNKIFVGLDYDYMLPAKAAIIIDCGANVGYATLFFLSKFPNAKIFCIEPEEETFKMLEKNTSDYSNVTRIKKAVWHSSGELVINSDYEVQGWGSVFVVKEDMTGKGMKVEATSLGDIRQSIGNKQIDILKVDIEGAELEVFSKNYESWLPAVQTLFIELHDIVKKGCGNSVFKATTQYSFSYYAKGENMIFVNDNIPT